jgi:hypothetical protein
VAAGDGRGGVKLWPVISAHGDIDTNAAIVGGIVGLATGGGDFEGLARRPRTGGRLGNQKCPNFLSGGSFFRYHHAVKDALSRQGWVAIRGVRSPEFVALARSLGAPRHRDGGVVERLRIRDRGDAPPRSLSGVHGRGAFPLHTDYAHRAIPPRYVLLRNASKGTVRPTIVATLEAMQRDQHATELLQRRMWIVRGGRGAFYAPVLFGAGRFVRWDAECMSPSALAADALAVWVECLSRATAIRIEWTEDTAIILDNWRVMHGRDGVAIQSDENRILERIAVS